MTTPLTEVKRFNLWIDYAGAATLEDPTGEYVLFDRAARL